MTGDIADTIDRALADWDTSQDAMRWAPDPPAPTGALRAPRIFAAMTAATAEYADAMSRLVGALAMTDDQFDLPTKALAGMTPPPHAQRRHDVRCRTCNPHGNPAPSRIDGHAYHRRRKARARRRR